MPTSTLERLGFSADERLVIFHADDLGMCHGANAAFADIVAAGVVNCGSIMVPCPWFNEIAAYGRGNPTADLGVHLTLTSEWATYRWGPLSTREQASGLLDEQGYLWRDVPSLHAQVDPSAAEAEMSAQIERAISAGLDVTHIDTHMGAVVHPQAARSYISLAAKYNLPLLLPRLTVESLLADGMPRPPAEEIAHLVAAVEAQGEVFMADRVAFLHSATVEALRAECLALLRALPPGLTHLVYHPSRRTPETLAIFGEEVAARRMGEWQLFSDGETADLLAEAGLRSIGYRLLREALRS